MCVSLCQDLKAWHILGNSRCQAVVLLQVDSIFLPRNNPRFVAVSSLHLFFTPAFLTGDWRFQFWDTVPIRADARDPAIFMTGTTSHLHLFRSSFLETLEHRVSLVDPDRLQIWKKTYSDKFSELQSVLSSQSYHRVKSQIRRLIKGRRAAVASP